LDLDKDKLGQKNQRTEKDRRTFLRELARCGGGALAIGSFASRLRAQAPVDWSKQIGIQLTVVRDQMAKDVESTLAQLAAIGYRFVNPVGFSGFDAKAYRAMLDRHGLSAPQIDLGFSIGPGMEEDLEACQILGIKYAEPALGGSAQRGNARGGGATDPYRGPASAGFRRLATPLTSDRGRSQAYRCRLQHLWEGGLEIRHQSNLPQPRRTLRVADRIKIYLLRCVSFRDGSRIGRDGT
jgi:hypothetical protein